MGEPDGLDGAARGEADRPSVPPAHALPDDDERHDAGDLAPNEAFQTLASEVRVAVLVRLLSAERAGEGPLSFSELHRATDTDSSAGFAYHLRQLTGHFVRQGEDGYALTPVGRRAAEAIVSGTFTDAGDRTSAS